MSGPLGRETVHYEAPAANEVPAEMQQFLDWFNASHPITTSWAAPSTAVWT